MRIRFGIQAHRRLLRLATVLLVFVVFSSEPLHSAAEHLIEYRAYQQAFETGDVAGALRHGEAAWRAAETALGDDPTTAVLAYNYARLAFTYHETAELARQAYARAIELSNKGIGQLPLGDLEIGLAEVKLILKQEERASADRLGELLGQRRSRGEAPTDVSAHAWKTLAQYRLRRKQRTAASEMADIAASEANQLQPPDVDLQADALILGALARLSFTGASRSQRRVDEATERLDQAIDMFPAQKTIDGFDRSLAQALLLRGSITSMMRSGFYGRETEQRDLAGMIPVDQEGSAHCPRIDDALNRTPVIFPDEAQKDGRVGAVLVGVDFNETAVERVVVLAEPSEGGFGTAAIAGISGWTLTEPFAEECRTNLFTMVSFVLK